ncbi:MAG: ABC transporter permease [Candidatus Eisenbacteria bacterium]
MKFWYVALKDLKIQLKDTGAMIILFVVPMVVITIASFALSGAFRSGESPLRVPLVDLDRSELSRELVAVFKEVGGITVEESLTVENERVVMTEERARERIEKGRRTAAILIPSGFGAKVTEGARTELVLLQDPASLVTPGIVGGILDGVAQRLSANALAVRVSMEQVMEATGGRARADETARRALERSIELQASPAVTVRKEDVIATREAGVDPFKQNVPGYAVMFALFTMMSGGGALLKERELGTMRRLLTTPVSRVSILVGKLLPNFITAVVQITVFFAFGRVVFGMDLGGSPAGLAVMAIVVALAATSLGILLASLVRSEAQLSGVSVLIILVMSGLGGSWWPLEIVPDFMQKLAHVLTITAWAMDGFKDVLWYGRGVVAVLPEAGTLLGFSLVAFTIGIWRFKLHAG